MKYDTLVILFNILKNALKVNAELWDEQNHKKYQNELGEKKCESFYGIIFNLSQLGKDVYTLDIFKPENAKRLEGLKRIHMKRKKDPEPQYDHTMPYKPIVFINCDLIEKRYNSGFTASIVKKNISPLWYEYPIALRTAYASIIVHELTHAQMDEDKYKGCAACFECKHCKYFYEKVNDNWIRIIEDDCLRKFDYAIHLETWTQSPDVGAFNHINIIKGEFENAYEKQ